MQIIKFVSMPELQIEAVTLNERLDAQCRSVLAKQLAIAVTADQALSACDAALAMQSLSAVNDAKVRTLASRIAWASVMGRDWKGVL